MTIYSLYIYDRHCACVYYHDWHRAKRPKPANEGGGLYNAVNRGVAPQSSESSVQTTPTFNSPRNTLSLNTGHVVAVGEPTTPLPQQTEHEVSKSNALPFDEEAKLVYGVVISLRNMVKKLSGRDELFTSYRTSAYRLHLLETVSGYKFVMLSDPNTDNLRFVMRQLYNGPFIDYAVRNPLVPMDSREQGIDNDYFRAATDRFIRGLSVFGP
ncbi:snare-like protein [Coniophora puteana RWD-64-598 SS2]|uniref:Trafficking protein particle complex subunit n=1 Tax=Coniophora puteana (strain RWD-64-598) TaxID=741705 RepID=A0A5M3MV52_CONPW|nr:snare-like protein [Coniophora puteana RWD-64-598 SS2]EIW82920.1 snare-like protein [Coniophora puteana RWD-64-598 SS2]